MKEVKSFKQKDLVLNVNLVYNTSLLNYSAWLPYIERLCGDRDYQKQAIEKAIIYLASNNYKSLNDLAVDNYHENPILREKYATEDDFVQKLHLPNQLYATIDLATGTGKSYLIYAISQIALGIGLVDRVLVLCPSLTIEKGLTEKFVQLSSDEKLRGLMPENLVFRHPRITDASSTVKLGDICVENIHAVYETTGSSIKDSFINTGSKTLVLNDEAHHIFNKISGNTSEDKSIKKWKDFLDDPKYGFKYMLGFTGTAYIDDEYFNDVIFRYSLRSAIEDKVVKNVDYVREDESGTSDEKLQKILQNHRENCEKYPRIKPLTIFVTKNIASAKNLADDLVDFIAKYETNDRLAAKSKVLLVTSAREHRASVDKLKYVDDKKESTEWIVSVSMLTEGWDVKNVFQVVPWEDRAFNSKLLIAQVLGRGLRLPEPYQSPQPKVVVFNHRSWSSKIKKLIEDVLEIEKRVNSVVLTEGERASYHFSVKNIDYNRELKEIESDFEAKPINFTNMWENGISLESQSLTETRETMYVSAISGSVWERRYRIEHHAWTVDEVLDRLFEEFEIREWEGKTLKLGENEYTKNNLPPRDDIRELIEMSMQKRGNDGDMIVEKNVHRILNAFTPLLRKKNKTVTSKHIWGDDTFEIDTRKLEKQSTSVSNLRRDSSVYCTNNWKNEISDPEQRLIIDEIDGDDSFPKSALKPKAYNLFKTPVSTVITSSKPERDFVDFLTRPENACLIEAWVKSRDRNFYEINYSYRLGSDGGKARRYSHKKFNPDFFIKLTIDGVRYILVVEIKMDKDVSVENKAKYEWSKKHFSELNERLKAAGDSERYIVHFLSSNGYSTFFDHLKNGTMLEGQDKYRCELEQLLEEFDDGM